MGSFSIGVINGKAMWFFNTDVYGKNFGSSKLAKKIYNKLVNSAKSELELDQEVNIPEFGN